MPDCLALDIGGANLKYSDGRGRTGSVPFALWQAPERLAEMLRGILAACSPHAAIGVTMTGELADCFPSKSAGVRQILTAVGDAAGERTVRIYLVDGRWVDADTARADPLRAAASNWSALARFAGRYAPCGPAVLLDIGSTTCDLIPLVDGRPVAEGSTDTQRLLAGELVYTGVERSPVCAVVRSVPYRGRTCPVAQELFATMRDVYLVLGELPEQPEDTQTADGRPATRAAASVRLARVICADETEFGADDAGELAAAAAEAQTTLVSVALARVASRLAAPRSPIAPRPEPRRGETRLHAELTVILSGHGDCLARRVLARVGHRGEVISLAERLGHEASRAATAYALATLLGEEHVR